MSFNGKMRQQEKLSKEDIKILRIALTVAIRNEGFNETETIKFLAKKLERMEKA